MTARPGALGSVADPWCGGDGLEARFLEAMSLLAPEMERFLIAAVRAGLACPGGERMAEAGTAFMREEAAHSLAHHRFNRALVAKGIDADAALAGVRRLSGRARRWLSPGAQLAVAAACEHLSAIVSLAYLRSQARSRIRLPAVEQLFASHARDEIAHRALVFDVMRATGGGGWWARALALSAVSTVALLQVACLVTRLMPPQRERRGPPWWQGAAGLARLARGASWHGLLRHGLMYLRPGFHPAQLPDH